jgi:hypothetical protein
MDRDGPTPAFQPLARIHSQHAEQYLDPDHHRVPGLPPK